MLPKPALLALLGGEKSLASATRASNHRSPVRGETSLSVQGPPHADEQTLEYDRNSGGSDGPRSSTQREIAGDPEIRAFGERLAHFGRQISLGMLVVVVSLLLLSERLEKQWSFS